MYVTRTSSIDYKMWRLIWLDWLPSPSTLCLSEITRHERESGQMREEQRLELYWHIIIAVGISEMTVEGSRCHCPMRLKSSTSSDAGRVWQTRGWNCNFPECFFNWVFNSNVTLPTLSVRKRDVFWIGATVGFNGATNITLIPFQDSCHSVSYKFLQHWLSFCLDLLPAILPAHPLYLLSH